MPLLSPKSLQKIFHRYKFNPEQKLGQNYLINEAVCKRALDTLDISAERDSVMEIGPGFGAITEFLWTKSKYVFLVDNFSPSISFLKDYFAPKTTIFLHDPRNLSYLHDFPAKAHINLVQGDILSIPFPKRENLKIISNVPFSISVPLLTRFVSEEPCKNYVLILQKQFFQHLLAQAGGSHYTFISALSSIFFHVDWFEEIPRNAYFPFSQVPTVLVKLAPTEKFQPKSLYYTRRMEFIRFLQVILQSNWKNKSLQNLTRVIPTHDPPFIQNYPQFVQVCNESEYKHDNVNTIPAVVLFKLMMESLT